MMFMGRIISSKSSHKNLQEHLLISRASRVLPMEQKFSQAGIRDAFIQNWGNSWYRAEEDEDFGGMEISQTES